jgi:hypothetical protein
VIVSRKVNNSPCKDHQGSFTFDKRRVKAL